MDCYPPCITCTGLCKQVPAKPPPQRATAKCGTTKQRPAYEPKQGYIVLVCGHYTTWEEQLATPGFRKSRRRYWCDKDGTWVTAYTMTERIAKLKEEPLF